ncbi:hypothetical protein GCM10027057_12440 [Marisediminicola antarctica]
MPTWFLPYGGRLIALAGVGPVPIPRDYSFRMPSARLVAVAVVGSAALLTGAATVGRYLVIRRRTAGMVRLADMIPVHSAHWREQQKAKGEVLYVAIGDSAAQGIGASKPGRSYVGLLARSIRRETGRTVRVVNLSQSGARLREALEHLMPRLAKLQPDVVTVSIGANDIASFDPERFERELRELYSALPPAAIVADLPSFYLGESERRVRIANEVVRRVAAELSLEVAPLHRTTLGRTAARTALRDVAADFFHPNDRGYAVWASAFEPLVLRAAQALDPGTPSTRS